jgi:hypothetical protein
MNLALVDALSYGPLLIVIMIGILVLYMERGLKR